MSCHFSYFLSIICPLADKLEVVKVTGLMGEELVLYSRLKAVPQPAKWLLLLENYMKTTVLTLMQACVQARLEDGMYYSLYTGKIER